MHISVKIHPKKILLFLISCVIVYYYVLPSGRYTIAAMIICIIGIVCCLMYINDNVVRAYFIKSLLLMGCLSITYFLITYPFDFDKAIGIITQQFLFIFPAFLVYFWVKEGFTTGRYLLFLALPVIYVIFRTMTELAINPTIARALAAGSSTSINLASYRMSNVGGFSFAYGMMFMSISLFFAFCKIRRSLILLVSCILSMLLVVQTQYLTAILLMFSSMYCILLYGSRNKAMRYLISFFILVCTFFALPFFLTWLASVIEIESLSSKLEQIASLLRLNLDAGITQGGLYGRIYVYWLSLKLFLQSPIFGNTITSSIAFGEHSTFLDLGVKAGLFGILVFLLELRLVFNLIQRANHRSGVVESASSYFIVIIYLALSVLNPTMNNFEISFYAFFFGPLIITYSYERRRLQYEY